MEQRFQGWIGYAGTHVPMFVHKLGLINQTNIALSQTMGFFNENMTWFFFVYFGQLLSGLSLIVGFFKNFGTVIVFSWLSQ